MKIIGIVAAVVFIFAEMSILQQRKKRSDYTYKAFVSNITIGICERLIYLLMLPVFTDLFLFLYTNYRLHTFQVTWYNWLFLLLFTDFVWYWYHRLGHTINIFWAAHIVHHQSSEFNFSVAARITIFQAYVRTLFWCLLPIAGFPVEMIFSVLIFHGTYSFFTHTRLTKRMDWLEYIFVTPSVHRVHHASNERYLDKNYGDVFVFWDRLFGTFQKEEEEPVYGLTKPLESNSFLWQHFHYYLELYYAAKAEKGILKKIGLFFSGPKSLDEHIRAAIEPKFLKTSDESLHQPHVLYINGQLLLTFVLLIFYTLYFPVLSWEIHTEVLVFSILTFVNIGAIIEQKRFVFMIESIRLIQLLFMVSFWFRSPNLFVYTLSFLLIVATLFPVKTLYFKTIFKLK